MPQLRFLRGPTLKRPDNSGKSICLACPAHRLPWLSSVMARPSGFFTASKSKLGSPPKSPKCLSKLSRNIALNNPPESFVKGPYNGGWGKAEKYALADSPQLEPDSAGDFGCLSFIRHRC